MLQKYQAITLCQPIELFGITRRKCGIAKINAGGRNTITGDKSNGARDKDESASGSQGLLEGKEHETPQTRRTDTPAEACLNLEVRGLSLKLDGGGLKEYHIEGVEMGAEHRVRHARAAVHTEEDSMFRTQHGNVRAAREEVDDRMVEEESKEWRDRKSNIVTYLRVMVRVHRNLDQRETAKQRCAQAYRFSILPQTTPLIPGYNRGIGDSVLFTILSCILVTSVKIKGLSGTAMPLDGLGLSESEEFAWLCMVARFRLVFAAVSMQYTIIT
ncbi:hypothetical protein B0H19DRAFT_1323987 [Mycena capillaripes]|nr:hypothetical protein B0H19DRAFT_1323987 [Mycena capillaripes]